MHGLIYNLACGASYEALARKQFAVLRGSLPECDYRTIQPVDGSAREVTLARPKILPHLGKPYDFVLQLEPDVEVVGNPRACLEMMIEKDVIQVQAGPTQIRRLYPPRASTNMLPAPWASFVFVPYRYCPAFFSVWQHRTMSPFLWDERVLLETLQHFPWVYSEAVRNATEPSHGECFVHHIGPDKRSLLQNAA